MVSQRSLFLLAAVLMMAALLLALPAFVVDSRSGTTHVQLEPDAFCDTVTEIPTIECDALVALYDSTDGPNWTDNTGWLETYTPCSWYGVTCSASHVSWLSLYDNQLSGSIPPELADLDNLQILWLHDNQLTGGIPIELGGLVNLQELYLHRNQLSGNIPPDLGGLTNLRTLRIGWNQLDGAIPPELGGLGNLEELFLTHNQLSGNIPPELGGLTNLRHLHLDSNQLNGSIPSELAGLANLVYLYLSYNQLSGEIPPWLGGLTNLEHLVLYENQLSGSIPLQLGGLANLTELHLSYNQLSGSIPPELGDLTNLKVLVLSSNQLSGEIPSELGGLANLAYLYLSNNQLSGSIPPELGSLTGLQGLSLQGNGLGAAIPAAIIDLVNLDPARTDLGYNMLTSSEPAVVAFLNEKDSDWADTQTVSPTGLKITWISDTSVEVSWEPIIYTGDGGYYEVSYATIAGGPYTVHGTTPDKTAAGYMAGGLSTGMTYYLVVRTHTPAHGDQQNELWSGFSQEVSATLAAEACQARINDHPTEYDDVQSAVDAAADGDVVKVAGYCSGVEHRPGVTQTVYMSKDITLRGGYSASDWTTPHPESNPTLLMPWGWVASCTSPATSAPLWKASVSPAVTPLG